MVGGFFLIYKADLTLKAFYLFYNDSNTKIEKCNRWFQIFVTDGLVYFRNRWSSIIFYELEFFY